MLNLCEREINSLVQASVILGFLFYIVELISTNTIIKDVKKDLNKMRDIQEHGSFQ